MNVKKALLLPIFSIGYVLVSTASEEIKKEEIAKPAPDTIAQQTLADGFAVKKISGMLFRYPWYVTRSKNLLPKSYSSKEINPDEEDTWFDAWATSPESDNWGAHGHPHLLKNFPQMLPLKLFLKQDQTLKTDGDTVELMHTDPYNKIVTQIVLTLQQRSNRGGEYGPFDACLRASKNYEQLIKPYIKEKAE